MSYTNQFVSAIKVHGKILRENNSTVALPFGAEYTILLKNLKSVRAIVEVTIDGESATGGEKLILDPNSELDFERYIRNRNLSSGNRFKFIERTETIEKHRGIKSSDGLVRVEFWAEKITPRPIITVTPYQYFPDQSNSWGKSTPNYPIICRGVEPSWTMNCAETSYDSAIYSASSNDTSEIGITVPGSESTQKFVEGSWFPTENESTVIVFHLVGKIESKEVTKPITVDVKSKCITCGKLNKATNKFCSGCGTSLILF